MSEIGPVPDTATLLSMLNAVPDVLLWCRYDEERAEAVVAYCNDSALHATGFSREEIIGSPARRLMLAPGEFDDPVARRSMWDMIKRTGVYEHIRPVAFAADEDRLLRVRIVWVDPTRPHVLIQARFGGHALE